MKRHASLLLSLFALCGCASGALPMKTGVIYHEYKNDKVQRLTESWAKQAGRLALNEIASKLTPNAVLSPASYLLAEAGLASVSTGVNPAIMGLNHAKEGLNSLLTAWNYEYDHRENEWGQEYSSFLSAILHQQVGPTYRFDETKRKSVCDYGVNTMVSTLDGCHEDATRFFQDTLGFTIDVPDPQMQGDGIITYGALKMKDYAREPFSTEQATFHGLTSTQEVDGYGFGSAHNPMSVSYAEGENYEAFSIHIAFTDLIIVLPCDDVAYQEVDVGAAFADFQDNATQVAAMGFVPYFHLSSDNVDLTDGVIGKFSNATPLYDALLADDVVNDLALSRVLQTSDFEFNEYGVAGESITAMVAESAICIEEEEIKELYVDRPFYVISAKDNFPLFVNLVTDISE